MNPCDPASPPLAPLLQAFFCDRLMQQRSASACTVAAYRDTFRLLLHYIQEHYHKQPSRLVVKDLDAPCILSFLNHLEQVRGNGPRTRNARLAAIRAFLQYAGWRNPLALPVAQRVLAIPVKRFERPLIEALSREEMHAVLKAPDADTFSGQRDRVMLTLMYNTGARVSEIIAWRVSDLDLERSSAIMIHGKGRKERLVPLWKSTTLLLRPWLKQTHDNAESPLIPNARGRRLTRSGVEHRLRLAVQQATVECSSLRRRQVSPHTIRHTTAMHLLQAGVDLSVIALWLGHESPATTHHYIEADLAMKQKALEKLEGPEQQFRRYAPSDDLLRFLEGL